MIAVAPAVRAAVGPDFHLLHDAVQTYDYVDAIRVGRVLQEEDYFWFEEPLRDYDTMGLKQLSDALDLPIAATEYLPGSIYSTSQLIAQQAVDIVRASVPWRAWGMADVLWLPLCERHATPEQDAFSGGCAFLVRRRRRRLPSPPTAPTWRACGPTAAAASARCGSAASGPRGSS